MILTVDVGNTNVSLGFFEGDALACHESFPVRCDHPETGYAHELDWILADKAVSGAIYSSVVPVADAVLLPELEARLGFAPLRVSPALRTGLTFGSYSADTLGADRIAGVVGAVALVGAPVAVFDLGTCTTLSVVGPDLEFLGGAIMPGIGMSLAAMHEHTGKLPSLTPRAPEGLIGPNTAQCMESGAIIGAAAVVDDFSGRLREQLGAGLSVILTGGSSALVAPWCRSNPRLEPHLQLLGLQRLNDLNR